MSSNHEVTVVQLVLVNETGDSYYRMRWPGQQLAAQAPNWRVINLDAQAKERFEWALEADLLVLYQSNDIDILPLIDRRRGLGKKTLVEYNDNFYAPATTSPVAGPWSSPLLWSTYEQIMRAGDAVIVTGPGLESLLSTKVDKEVHILENHYPFELGSFEDVWQPPQGEIRIAWAGSVGHMPDILAVSPTIRELLEEIPQLHLHIMGLPADAAMLGLPEQRVSFVEWGTMDDYFAFWKPMHIGFAPMLNTPYNHCRSDIKAIEMSACGALPLVTNRLPYKKFLEQTQMSPFLSFAELKSLLHSYVNNQALLEEDARRCFNYVKDSRRGSEHRERLEFYSRFLPPQQSQFSWPLPTGYHEVQGTTSAKFMHDEILRSTDQLSKVGKIPEALALFEEGLKKNPYDVELCIAHLKCLIRAKDSTAIDALHAYIQRFPEDLRFRLFNANSQTNVGGLVGVWLGILNRLASESQAYREFFCRDIVRLFSRHLARCPDLHTVAVKLLEIYPNNATLRFRFAEWLEQQGQYQAAVEQFRWVEQRRREHLQNEEFLSALETSYVQSWREALEARLKGSQD